MCYASRNVHIDSKTLALLLLKTFGTAAKLRPPRLPPDPVWLVPAARSVPPADSSRPALNNCCEGRRSLRSWPPRPPQFGEGRPLHLSPRASNPTGPCLHLEVDNLPQALCCCSAGTFPQGRLHSQAERVIEARTASLTSAQCQMCTCKNTGNFLQTWPTLLLLILPHARQIDTGHDLRCGSYKSRC